MEQQDELPKSQEQRFEEELAEVRSAQKDFQDLLSHPGWARLRELAQEQIATRKTLIFAGDWDKFDALISSAAFANQVHGIELFLRLPMDIIEELKERHRRLINQENDDGGQDDERILAWGALPGHDY